MLRVYRFFESLMFVVALWLIADIATAHHLDQRIDNERTACESLHDASLKTDACSEYHKLFTERLISENRKSALIH